MPRIPRDISGKELAKLRRKYDYKIERRGGSHIRLVSHSKGFEHKIIIPDHESIKIGTLNNILNDLADYLKMTKEKLIEELFKK